MKKSAIITLKELETLRENLFALSDYIWLNINHNDEKALDECYNFKKKFNKKMIDFDKISSEISEMIKTYLNIDSDEEEEIIHDEKNNVEEGSSHVIPLNKEVRHNLNEDLCYKRPYGFMLNGKVFKNITTWRNLYKTFCRQLAIMDIGKFRKLPENEKFVGRRHKCFSQDPNDLYVGLEISHGIYAEGNFSANSMRDTVIKLLGEFEIDFNEFQLYLREDRKR